MQSIPGELGGENVFGSFGLSQSSLLVRRQKRSISELEEREKYLNNREQQIAVKHAVQSPSPYYGLYSGTGFDMLGILARVATRPNPIINLGPIDMSSSFIVTDALREDLPIIYASPTFELLTGYTSTEIMGRNCRFLQSPDGRVERGALRQFVDNNVVYQLKKCVDRRMECQYININYKKGGEPFVNLITIIPISYNANGDPSLFVGFQVDLMKQSGAILRTLEDHSYVIDFSSSPDTLTRPSSDISPRLVTASSTPNACFSTASPSDYCPSPDACDPHTFAFSPGNAPSINIEACMMDESIMDKFLDPDDPSLLSLTEPPQDNISIPSPVETHHNPYIERPIPAVSSAADAIDPGFISHYSLVQNAPDFIHILSSRGIILFASPTACQEILEYEAGELIGRNISQFCHAGDLISLMRELKCAGLNDSVSAVYRFRRKQSGYVWLEIKGHKYEMANRKRTKCFILSGRQRWMGSLDQSELIKPIMASPPGQDSDLWGKLTPNGFFIYLSRTSAPILGTSIQSLYGQSILDYIYEGDRPRVVQKLYQQSTLPVVGEGTEVRCSVDNNGRFMPAVVAIYPGARRDECEAEFLFVRVTLASRGHASSRGCAFGGIAPPLGERACGPFGGDLGFLLDDDMSADIFASVGVDQSTSLQYELNQLRMSNKRLQEELDILQGLTGPSVHRQWQQLDLSV
ncbi:PAS domain S-box protein, variant 2 [Spizellomyces punctatus DAOM BR117]|uniref:PAS domain S-box protein, variant 2 n=1 Tax=Spizellomyces punctatus (strain DAOM BR117) TaxID=645134 RepID=A0A0L0HM57_SPIPD|nr:PAS domain S-box protein, variant 2 [Spizellomyces punctatus DAOM BR117]KND02172.1 PAS domain S-box protein, variant 2 [Spizellomyces punctatus DAOM BR117]|eukprot:XP_016610211.1 PAS domain S-box protein, variant 2 [Spizellomyces punctatus DAOM BR117]